MQFMISFNPVSELNWLKQRFFDEAEEAKIMVLGEQQAKALSKDVNERISVYNEPLKKNILQHKYNILVTHSTYLDNHFIDANYVKEMEDLKRYDIDEYNIYSLGQWGVPGGTYFDKKAVNQRIKEVRQLKPLKRGYFEFEYVNDRIVENTIQWVEDEEGYIKIFEEPNSGYPYVLGGDTSGEGSDYNTACLTNNVSKEDAASIRLNFDEDLYARQVYCLARMYNNALIGIEINFSTHPQKELERWNYPNMYIRDEEPDAYTGRLTKRYGFMTTKLTRPLALGMLRQEVREHPERIKDIDTLEEMTTFVKNEKGRPEAAEGKHDDMIMARAINKYISQQQTEEIVKPKIEKTAIEKDKEKLAKILSQRNKRFGR